MKQLVEAMLTLAKSDDVVGSNVHGRVDFSYIVKSAVLMYEPIAFDEKKKLTCEIESGLYVLGDEQRLQQVIHILLDNAQKYSSAEGAIHVRLNRPEGQALLLMVENEGEPIPERELDSIFLRFYRRDESRSGHESFGLGLSIAQSIIDEHKGKIWAESDGVSKNRFYIKLALVQ